MNHLPTRPIGPRFSPASIVSVNVEPGLSVKIYTPAYDWGQWPIGKNHPEAFRSQPSVFLVYTDRDPGDEDD